MKQKPNRLGLLPDGRHTVKVVRVEETDQITILFANSQGYSTLWLNLNEFACGVLYGILHCAGRPYKHYTDAEKLKQDLIGCRLQIDILNNQIQCGIKIEKILQSY